MKRFFALLIALVLLLLPMAAYAESDNAGNGFVTSGGNVNVDGDLFAVIGTDETGSSISEVSFSGNVGGSFIGVSYDKIVLDGVQIGGSVHFASLYGIKAVALAARNLTVATSELELDSSCTIKGVYAVAEDAKIKCRLDRLAITATKVCIFDEIGQADITAETVYIKSGLDVSGFNIESVNEPQVFDDVPANAYSYKQSSYADTLKYKVYEEYSASSIVSNTVLSILMTYICSAVLLALLKKRVGKCTAALKTRTGGVIGFGLLALIGLPIAAIILLLTYIGLPIAAVAILLYIAMLILADSITACVLAQLVLPKLNSYLGALICSAVIVVLQMLPFVGMYIAIASCVVAFGTVIRSFTVRDDNADMQLTGTDFQNPYTV